MEDPLERGEEDEASSGILWSQLEIWEYGLMMAWDVSFGEWRPPPHGDWME